LTTALVQKRNEISRKAYEENNEKKKPKIRTSEDARDARKNTVFKRVSPGESKKKKKKEKDGGHDPSRRRS